MAKLIAQRLLGVVGILFAMSILVFCIVHILPGNVAYAILGEYATPDAIATLEAKLGLNDPLIVQYWHWLSGMLRGDLGQSIVMERSAAEVIADALGRSAILAAFSFVLVAVGGVVLGTYAATHDGRLSDRVLTLIQFLFIAVPDFFWSILVIIVFASWLHWLPATGYVPFAQAGFLVWLSHLVLPVLVLATGLVAHVSRMTRSSMLEVLESRYVLAARAKGLPERLVLRRHALPNALLPTITILAIDVGILIGGVVVVETVFAYPGLGRMLVFAIEHHDLPLLQAGMMVVTAIYALANLVADLGYAYLNPRIRFGKAAA
ncbi:peptide/nickel transport system permease protein [Rhizobiales bacterium GAS191]|nr:peptide/nickel transport system permease protein [Rhizobiales bacterium GAS191]